MALYEPYLLLLAIVGLIMLLRRPNALTAARWPIVVWPLLVLVSCALRPGSTPVSLSASILPIALLGGHAVEVIAGGVRPASWRWIGLHTLVSFVFWIPGLLALTPARERVGRCGSDRAYSPGSGDSSGPPGVAHLSWALGFCWGFKRCGLFFCCPCTRTRCGAVPYSERRRSS